MRAQEGAAEGLEAEVGRAHDEVAAWREDAEERGRATEAAMAAAQQSELHRLRCHKHARRDCAPACIPASSTERLTHDFTDQLHTPS